jgi:hypothetical protein
MDIMFVRVTGHSGDTFVLRKALGTGRVGFIKFEQLQVIPIEASKVIYVS